MEKGIISDIPRNMHDFLDVIFKNVVILLLFFI